MRESTRNFMVGLVSIGALLGLAVLMFAFGEFDRLFHPRYAITLLTDDAAGLRPGGAVEFNGVPVGVVDSVETRDPRTNRGYPVRIVALIDQNTPIPADSTPFAATPLIGGSARLQLQSSSGASADRPAFPTDGTATIEGEIRSGLLEEIATQLDMRMKPIVESLDEFKRLSETYNEVGRNLNDLLKPQDAQALASGEAPNIRTAVTTFNRMLDDTRQALDLAKSWLGDEQLRADAQQAISKAALLIDKATESLGQFTATAQALQGNADDLTRHLLPVADQLGATLEDVQRVAKLAADGRGTLAQLLNNPDLYNALTDAAIRLERALTEIRLLVEKLRAEGVKVF